jgi:hypothetical protein
MRCYVNFGDAILVYREYYVCALERYIKPGTRVVGVRDNWGSTGPFSDDLVKSTGRSPKRVILAAAHSGGKVTPVVTKMQSQYRIVDRREFYDISVLIFSPVR